MRTATKQPRGQRCPRQAPTMPADKKLIMRIDSIKLRPNTASSRVRPINSFYPEKKIPKNKLPSPEITPTRMEEEKASFVSFLIGVFIIL